MLSNSAKIAVVTDSTSDLSEEQLKANGIRLLPLKVIYKDREFIDRQEIQPEQVYENFAREIPKTSMPSPGEAVKLFQKLADEGFTDVISIHISSALSGTVQMMKTVAKQMKDVINIEVIDSKSVSIGSGFLALEAKRLVGEGRSFSDIVEQIQALQKKVKVFFVVKTLEYLKKGGRIGCVSSTIGEILNVKPIISVNEEGVYYSYQNVRGRKRSLDKLVEIVKDYAKDKKISLAILHGDALEEAQSIRERLKLPNIELKLFGQIGPVIAVHAGPGVVGVSFFEQVGDK